MKSEMENNHCKATSSSSRCSLFKSGTIPSRNRTIAIACTGDHMIDFTEARSSLECYLSIVGGVDVILDNMGGSYFQRNLDCLSLDGRLFIIGFQGGSTAEVNLSPMLAKRLTVQAAGLRGRSLENQAKIVKEVEKNVWPVVAAGKVKPIVYKTFPLAEAAKGHSLMESSSHIGKILLMT